MQDIQVYNNDNVDRKSVAVIKDTIDINDYNSVISFGVKPMQEIANFSTQLLGNQKGRDSELVGDQLNELVMKIKEYDPLANESEVRGFLSKIPFLNRLAKRVEKIQIDHMTLASQVDTISASLDNSMVGLLKDNTKMENLYSKNIQHYKELSEYVVAGKEKSAELKNVELPRLQKIADESKDLLDIQNVKDLVENINRFDRRIHELEISKTVSMQTAPQIRIIQNNNQQLAEKIQGSILSTLPMWKSQMVLAQSLAEQERAVALQKDVSDTTNALLLKNAEILQTNSVMTAQEAERAIVDIDTIREVQNKLVSTIEETMKIAVDGRQKRLEVERELGEMEDNLRERINTVVEKYSGQEAEYTKGRTFEHAVSGMLE